MSQKSTPIINYDFVIQALNELSSQKDKTNTKHHLINYLYSLFSPTAANIKDEALIKLYTYPGIEEPKTSKGMLDFIASYYRVSPVHSELEMSYMAHYFKDLMAHASFKDIEKCNKDSTFFNAHYKKEKALLSDGATTQDVLDLIDKITRYKDLELIIKILGAYHSQTKGANQSIDLPSITNELNEKINPSSTNYRYSTFREPDSAGKLYRLLELGQIATNKIDAGYFGIVSNRPVFSKPNNYNNYIYATSGVDASYARKSLISLTYFWADKLFNHFYTPAQIKELMEKVFSYERAEQSKPKEKDTENTKTMIRNLVGFVQSQKTDLKTLSIVCPHIKAFFEENKAKGNFTALNFPVASSSSSEKSVGDVGVYWVLGFISNNSAKIKEITGETSENILKALIKIENQKLAKSMIKIKDVPTDKPKHNKI